MENLLNHENRIKTKNIIMEEGILIQLIIPEEFDYALSIHLINLKRAGVKTTKANLIMRLARIGWIKESKELIKEEK